MPAEQLEPGPTWLGGTGIRVFYVSKYLYNPASYIHSMSVSPGPIQIRVDLSAHGLLKTEDRTHTGLPRSINQSVHPGKCVFGHLIMKRASVSVLCTALVIRV